MRKIFLSYSRASAEATKMVAQDLHALGHEVWFDQNLTGGQAWWEEILRRMRDSDLVVFLICPESIASAACRRELDYAVALGKSILPLAVRQPVSPNLVPQVLARLQIVDCVAHDRAAVIHLVRAIGAAPGSPPLPDPLPAEPAIPATYLGDLLEVAHAHALSFEQQAAVVLELRQKLRDPQARTDAVEILRRLRSRGDLAVTVAGEIDELLERHAAHSEQASPVVRRPAAANTVQGEGVTADHSNMPARSAPRSPAIVLGLLGLVAGVAIAAVLPFESSELFIVAAIGFAGVYGAAGAMSAPARLVRNVTLASGALSMLLFAADYGIEDTEDLLGVLVFGGLMGFVVGAVAGFLARKLTRA